MSLLLLASWLAAPAQAFCGFYVGGATGDLYNDATMVVLMREGTRTVLSMQNNYQGPPEGFAMVVPVPQVLQKENVKILPKEVFAHVDALSAPRLVEYWEQDPCAPPRPVPVMSPRAVSGAVERKDPRELGVTIEARFEVGEYDVVILSAKDSSGLETWLKQERYAIPAGAEPVLRPYVAAGTKFFVAKVLPEKVRFEDGRAVLSPLRVHYDDERFSLPVRLGLLNSKGQQDLIVNVLAPGGQRYEVANYDNVFVPTNLRVRDAVREDFGAFYEGVFSQVAKPGTVVTEYAWDAGTCDPCPSPPLQPDEIATLGGDLSKQTNARGYTLTRLHYRYGPEGLKEDLVFRTAPPVVGGRGMPNADGEFAELGATPSSVNNFQGRYTILHRWEGEPTCDTPHRGFWGGPPGDRAPEPVAAKSRLSTGAAAAPTPMVLAEALIDPIPGVTPRAPAQKPAGIPELGGPPPDAPPEEVGIPELQEGRCSTGPLPGGALPLAGLAGLFALGSRRRGGRGGAGALEQPWRRGEVEKRPG